MWFWNVAKNLAKRGHNIYVITYKYARHVFNEYKNGIKIYRAGLAPIKNLNHISRERYFKALEFYFMVLSLILISL